MSALEKELLFGAPLVYKGPFRGLGTLLDKFGGGWAWCDTIEGEALRVKTRGAILGRGALLCFLDYVGVRAVTPCLRRARLFNLYHL